ncbi:ATP-binding cassette subfamily B protein [Silvibacterium bohemicum]|uniref:ATP-binding cassette subfamily B protein n=1 Tax=Silvibacterium bohemicum TaxID=1577686 RepID=A0A841JUQ5_9BACT|nr:ABC transporter ATP-binding protein [Silvibacterium bohemicum]MBB6144890.1 ATP-binding cassette subfamily B protein [Silvibacterium bohemicum]
MAEQAKPKQPQQQDDDVVGKAYDARLMGRLLTYLYPYKFAAIVSLVAILIKATCDVLGPYLTEIAIDRYMSAHPSPKSAFLARWLSSNPVTGITQIAMIYLGSLLLSYLFEFIQTYLMQWTGQKIMFDMRKQIFGHLQTMHVGFYDRNPVGRLVTRLTSDVDALNELFTSGVFAIFEDIFVLAGIVFVMLRMKWWLALIAFAVLPLILIATRIFRKHVRDSYRRIRSAIARINSYTQEHVTGMSLIQLFNRQDRAFRDFEAVNRTHMDAFKDSILAYALYYPAVEICSSMAIAAIIWIGGRGVMRGAVTVGVLVAFIQYAQRFFRPIQDLSEKYNILQAAMAASERVFKLIDTEPEIVSPAHPIEGDHSGSIEFRNVWFTYQRMDEERAARVTRASEAEIGRMEDIEWILRGVSFTIRPDQTAAIVGHTGAGKTTIISLMMRFYDIQHGEILIDGVDVRRQDLRQLREHFGVVLQDPFLFSGTIGSNIKLGTSRITDEEMERAAEQVNVHDFIASLPQGYNEELRERGNSLSTGQKQLINFARALAHNPRILILDEATSSVDTDTEIRVRIALDRMIQGRTSVVIAHRLSTVQRADVILVMHKGQLRETGSHQQLLTQRGLYWKLYQLQYKDQELGLPSDGLTPTLALGTD